MRASDLRKAAVSTWVGILCGTLNACGGGGTPAPIPTPSPVAPTAPTLQQRMQAASQTAQNNSLCTAIQPFYWEIGDRNSMLAAGTSGGSTPTGVTPMLIASSSKWIFGAYVVQLRNGQLTADDLSALTMHSGYTNLNYSSCIKLIRANQDAETVHDCFSGAP
jgi:hypothetical protein